MSLKWKNLKHHKEINKFVFVSKASMIVRIIFYIQNLLVIQNCRCAEAQTARHPAKFIGESSFYDNLIISLSYQTVNML